MANRQRALIDCLKKREDGMKSKWEVEVMKDGPERVVERWLRL
jgi:hypothetical protein